MPPHPAGRQAAPSPPWRARITLGGLFPGDGRGHGLPVGAHRPFDHRRAGRLVSGQADRSLALSGAETGIVGFALWFAFVGYGFWMMYRIVRFEPEFEDEDDILEWQDARAIALVLLVAQAGFFAAAFFLSRSYVILLYLLAALVVAHHSNVLARFPALGELRLGNHIVRWFVLTLGAVMGFYVVLKVLLAMG